MSDNKLKKTAFLKILDGINWVKDLYYKSPGFMQRLSDLNIADWMGFRGSEYDPNIDRYETSAIEANADWNTIDKYGITNPWEIRNAVIAGPFLLDSISLKPKNRELKSNGEYNSETKHIRVGEIDKSDQWKARMLLYYDYVPYIDYDDLAAHEAGHALSKSMKHSLINTRTGSLVPEDYFLEKVDYPDLFPILRLNNYYEDLVYGDLFKLRDAVNKRPWYLYLESSTHDARPSEAYADLIAARYLLYKNNIYDSTLENNEFKQEHLDALRELYPNLRIFKMFDDETLIKAMNTVADNNLSPSKNEFNLYSDYSYT